MDNMLWHGQVYDAGGTAEDTQPIREITRLRTAGNGWSSSLAPIRDGVMPAIKR